MEIKENRELKDEVDRRYGTKISSLFRCVVYLLDSRSSSSMFVHYRRRPAGVSS